jgi:hypothetical protein
MKAQSEAHINDIFELIHVDPNATETHARKPMKVQDTCFSFFEFFLLKIFSLIFSLFVINFCRLN